MRRATVRATGTMLGTQCRSYAGRPTGRGGRQRDSTPAEALGVRRECGRDVRKYSSRGDLAAHGGLIQLRSVASAGWTRSSITVHAIVHGDSLRESAAARGLQRPVVAVVTMPVLQTHGGDPGAEAH